jgi:hypothetical protein
MATVSVVGARTSGVSNFSRSTGIRPALWRALVVLGLVAIHAGVTFAAWQWCLSQMEPTPGSFGQGLAYLMLAFFTGQAFLFGFWLTWTPMPVWFRLPLVFAIVYSVSLAVFDVKVLYGALAMVLIAAAFLEPLRLFTKWRCDYAPNHADLNALPPFPLRLNLRDVGESVVTLAAFFVMAYAISGSSPGEMQFGAWAYLTGVTFFGLVLCLPVMLVVFSPNSRSLWIAIGVGNGAVLLLLLIGMAVFPISILYAIVVAGIVAIPQMLCAGTLLILKQLGWRFFSVASEVRPARIKSLSTGRAKNPSLVWNASVIAAMAAAHSLFAVAMMRGMSEMTINNQWIAFLIQGPGIGVLIGQLLLLGMWSAWTPMPSWLRFPIILGIGYAVGRLILGSQASTGVLGALILMALLEPLRMVTKWRCDYRPDVPELSALPPVTLKWSLWEIFEAILSWACIFGSWRVLVALSNDQPSPANVGRLIILLSLIPVLGVPASLLVYSPRSKWLWGIVITVVALHFVIGGIFPYWGSVFATGITMWSVSWFSSAGACAATLLVLKQLGWRFYSAHQADAGRLPASAYAPA